MKLLLTRRTVVRVNVRPTPHKNPKSDDRRCSVPAGTNPRKDTNPRCRHIETWEERVYDHETLKVKRPFKWQRAVLGRFTGRTPIEVSTYRHTFGELS